MLWNGIYLSKSQSERDNYIKYYVHLQAIHCAQKYMQCIAIDPIDVAVDFIVTLTFISPART